MDPEQTFIRVQERFSQLLKPRIRAALEYFYVVVAVALFCLLVVMHANYVQQPGCSSELSIVETSHAELVQIKITSIGLQSQNAAESNVNDDTEHQLSTGIEVPNVDGDGMMFSGAKFWSNWVGSGARRSKLVLKSWKTENEYLGHLADTPAGSSSSEGDGELDGNAHIEDPHVGLPISARESFETAFIHFCSKWQRRFSFLLRHAKNLLGSFSQFWNVSGEDMLIDVPKWLHMFYFDKVNAFAVQWLETRGRSFEPTYLYTVEKGYFLLPEGAKSRHNIRTVNISISARNSCFGNRWQQLLINKFVGYDTILMNSLLSSPGQGYLYNCQTKEFYDLSYAHEITEGSSRFGDYLVTKCGVLIMSLFVFFTTTMSVSFTLRETQTRMLKFTVQLQHHARHRLPTFQLIFVHVTESLVFVPIMIGILFFLFEFYDDQLLAFMVLILVWLCELFTLISVRTPISMKFFPRFFLLYFLVFHIYFFSYAYGFSYLAFATTAVFMQHLILYFWNRFEVPALQRYMQNRRSHFQQHPDIHITSSAILASTLHITRLNVRNPVLVPVTGPAGNNIRPAGSALASPQADQAAAATNRVPPANGAPVAADLFSEIQSASGVQNNMLLEEAGAAPPQPQALPEDASNPSSMNSFGSWFMEGASGRLNSVISLFRDIGDQGHVYTGPPQRLENEHNSSAAAPAPLDSPTRID